MMHRLQAVFLVAVLAFASAAHATTEDTRAKTQSDPVIATPEAAKAQLYSGGIGYTYTIDLPPAAGITLDLQLSYSSLTGITEYGKGWSLNLSKIERSTRAGPPAYADPNSGIDEFEIDGSLLLLDPDLAYRFNLEQYDHRRILYIPGSDSWEVTNPDGTKFLYGSRTAANSRLANDGSGFPAATFRWSLDKVIDPRGNYYEVDYAYETFLHPQSEDDSIPPIQYNMNNHPDVIRYSYHDSESTGRKRRIVEFQWEMRGELDYNDDLPTSYRSGFKIQISKRLSEIKVGTDDDGSGQVDPGEQIRRYEFTYTEKPTSSNTDTYVNPVFSQLEAIQRYGSGDEAFPSPTVFTYKAITRGSVPDWDSGYVEWALPEPGDEGVQDPGLAWKYPGSIIPYVDFHDDRLYGSIKISTLVDINGDGFTDFVALIGNPAFTESGMEYLPPGGGEWWVAYGPFQPGGSFEGVENGLPDQWGFGTPERWKWSDGVGGEHNGGGAPYYDLRFPYDTYVGHAVSRHDELFTEADFIDLNGDGLVDFVDGGAAYNLGDSACTDEGGNPVGCFGPGIGPPGIENIMPKTWAIEGDKIVGTLADVDGDGLPDWVQSAWDSFAWIAFNNGNGFTPGIDWIVVSLSDMNPNEDTNYLGLRGQTTSSTKATRQMFADMNGDGLADRNGWETCLRMPVHAFSLGSGWQSWEGSGQWFWDDRAIDDRPGNFCQTGGSAGIQPQITQGGSTTAALVDLNGDGILDYYHRSANGVDPQNNALNIPAVYFGLGDGSYLTVDDVVQNNVFGVPQGIEWPMNGGGWTSVYGAIRDYSDNPWKITQMTSEFIDMNGDGLQDFVENPFYDYYYEGDPVPYLKVWFHPGPSGLLESVKNELGGVTRLEYKPSTWFRDKTPDAHADSVGEGGYESNPSPGAQTSKPTWVLTKITVEDGRNGADQTQSIEYADFLYDFDRHEYIGARMAESTDAASVLTRSFFHQSVELRPRLEFTETLDPSGKRVRTEKTEWTAVAARNETYTWIPGAWFPKPLKTISTLIDPNPPYATSSRIVNRLFDDRTGLLFFEKDWGPDEIKNTADDYATSFQPFNPPNFGDWLISYPISTYSTAPGGSAYQFFYYDGLKAFTPPQQGLLTKRVTTQDTNVRFLEKWSYDAFGNQTEYFDGRAVAAGETVPTRATEYDTDFDAFPVKITNALGHVTEFAFDADFGEVSKVLDPNGYLQCWEYDAFGRLDALKKQTQASTPGSTCSALLASFSFPLIGVDPSQQHIQARRYPGGGASSIESRSFIDGLGRIYQEEEERKQNQFAITVRSWGPRGELACESFPKLGGGGSAIACTAAALGNTPRRETTYDALLRPSITTRKSSTSDIEIKRFYKIADLDLKTGNELIETRVVKGGGTSPDRIVDIGTDPSGRVVAVSEHFGGLTTLQRDPKGRIVVVDGPLANDSLSITYNHQDQRTSLSGFWGDLGWSYAYDLNGNLIEQSSPAGTTIKFHWDKLNRLGVKDYGNFTDINSPNLSEDIVYTYDNAPLGIGRLIAVTTPGLTSVDTSFGYNAKGLVKAKVRDFGGSGVFAFSYVYDRLGRRKSATLPNAETIFHDYDGLVLKKIRASGDVIIADTVQLHANGAITSIDYPRISPGKAQYTYESNTYRLDTAVGTANGATVQNLNFDYDLAGNLKTVTDALGQFSQTFSYDALHRISMANSTGSEAYTGTLNFGYDFAGNMTTKGPLVLDYNSPNGGPHAVSSVVDPAYPPGGNAYNYDFDGGLTQRIKHGVTQNLTHDDDGRVTSVAGGSGAGAAYVYDESGERSRKMVFNNGPDILYVDPELEVDIVANKHKVHYFHGSRRIATENRYEVGLPGEEGDTQSWQYYFPDFVGSNSVVASDLNVPQKSRFKPFGEFTQTDGGLSEYLFTDQENDPESGLMYYGARYYDPWVGRFCSQDPALIGSVEGVSFDRISSDPQNFNTYSYVLNRPTVMVDVNGEFGVLGAAVGGGFQLVREIGKGSFEGGVMTKEGAKALARIGVSAAVGAVTGGVGSAVSKSVVGLAGKELVKAVATNATANAAVGAAAAGAGQVAVNTAEAAIDGGVSGAGAAIADGSVLSGAGNAAVNGAAAGAAGSVIGDVISSALGASPILGDVGTLSPAGSAIGVSASNAVGNLSPSDIPETPASGMEQHNNGCQGGPRTC